MNFGLEKQVTEMNRRLLAISKEAVGACALVAGDLTTTGKLLEPRGDLSYETLYQIYQEQIKALADAGADLLVAETMLSVDETVAALDAAQSVCDLPVMCTLSFGGGWNGFIWRKCRGGCDDLTGDGGGSHGAKLFCRTRSAGSRGGKYEKSGAGSHYRQAQCRHAGDQ